MSPAVSRPSSAAALSGITLPGEADDTRSALIRAGIDLFGHRGFDGASTREIARAAGVNIAGIAYHFGGKAGLHRACGEALAAFVRGVVGDVPVTPEGIATLDPDVAADLFVAAVEGIGRFMLGRPEAESIARFMVREQMDPSETFAVLYATLIRPRHEVMCRLFARATGEDAASEAVIIAVSAMFGQIMFFRVGRATALARLGLEVIDPPRLDAILAAVTTSIRATVAARRAAFGEIRP
jgi:AcrR family transcriptional regulator